MSRCRITAKLRKNEDFRAVADHLDALGYRWTAHPPKGKGHPFLRILLPNGKEADFTVSCTPRGSGNKHNALGNLRFFLAKHGV